MYCSKSLLRKSLRILISDDLGMRYEEALGILWDDVAWENGEMLDNTPDFVNAGPYMQLLDVWNNISIIDNCIVQIK